MKNNQTNGVSALFFYQAAAVQKEKRKYAQLRLKKKGVIQCIAGKKGLAELAGVLG
jgi:hypothetical protein